MQYGWPGNVRELKNVMERLSFLVFGRKITRRDLIQLHEADGSAPVAEARSNHALDPENLILPENGCNLDELCRAVIQKALEMNEGNRTRAAGYLGISRRSLYTRMEKYGLK